MKTIQNAWSASKKSFIIDRKLLQIRYNAGQTWEVDLLIMKLVVNPNGKPHRYRGAPVR